MNIIIIVVTALVVMFIFRLIVLSFCSILPRGNEGFDLFFSIALLIVYLASFIGAVEGVISKVKIINLEGYLIYTFIGIASTLWCYFSWNLDWTAKPQFMKNDSQMIKKKIIVFSVLMVFAFYQGYTQLDMIYGGKLDAEKEMLVKITNITIVPGIIALDRVLNQIYSYIKENRKTTKE